MEEVVWNIKLGKVNIRWRKQCLSPFIHMEKGKDFCYLGIGKLVFVIM